MTLSDISFIDLLPTFMREDDANIALAGCCNLFASTALDAIKNFTTWNCLDTMTEEELDALAYEKDITWYKYNADIDTKRNIIKNATAIKMHLGTKWAVEQVGSIYFDDVEVVEWFDYDGDPFHFKIKTTNSETINDDAEAFLKILNTVKRESAVLDVIEVMETSSMNLLYIIKAVDSETITHTLV